MIRLAANLSFPTDAYLCLGKVAPFQGHLDLEDEKFKDKNQSPAGYMSELQTIPSTTMVGANCQGKLELSQIIVWFWELNLLNMNSPRSAYQLPSG